jgi:hypothetical protein
MSNLGCLRARVETSIPEEDSGTMCTPDDLRNPEEACEPEPASPMPRVAIDLEETSTMKGAGKDRLVAMSDDVGRLHVCMYVCMYVHHGSILHER